MSELTPLVRETITAVTAAAGAGARQGRSAHRSFGDLLSEAEAVQDFVTLRYAHTPQSGPLTGWLRGAMPLWLLRRMGAPR